MHSTVQTSCPCSLPPPLRLPPLTIDHEEAEAVAPDLIRLDGAPVQVTAGHCIYVAVNLINGSADEGILAPVAAVLDQGIPHDLHQGLTLLHGAAGDQAASPDGAQPGGLHRAHFDEGLLLQPVEQHSGVAHEGSFPRSQGGCQRF